MNSNTNKKNNSAAALENVQNIIAANWELNGRLLIALQKINTPNVTNSKIKEQLTRAFEEVCDESFEDIKGGSAFSCIKYEDPQRIG